jgi:hypothetical protein
MNHDDLPRKRSLSEISHLFLSSVRDIQTNGTPRPRRVPPPKKADEPSAELPQHPMPERKQDLSIDLTPEEFAQVFGSSAGAGEQHEDEQGPPLERTLEVSAILGAHLNGRQLDRVKEYARHLALQHGRTGLIELDASEFRVTCFERDAGSPQFEEPLTVESYDVRQMAEALEEMSWDVHRWLLLVPNLRTPEARQLLRAVDHWVLLSTCDHDGIVSSYRVLKGLADGDHPARLSLALLDSADEAESTRVYQKISSVCEQFLNWRIDSEPAVRPAPRIAGHLVLCCQAIHDKAQLATAPQWSVVAEFLANAGAMAPKAAEPAQPDSTNDQQAMEEEAMLDPAATTAQPSVHQPMQQANAADAPIAAAQQPVMRLAEGLAPPTGASGPDAVTDVLELTSDDPDSILGAILKQNGGDLVECPVRPPMCAGARLAVSRDRGMVMLVVARQGLGELRAVGQAYRWMLENRALLGMALPQFAIDAQRMPRLRMLVDQADVRADILQPMLESEHVSVQAYRRLRWGSRIGFFLEAA